MRSQTHAWKLAESRELHGIPRSLDFRPNRRRGFVVESFKFHISHIFTPCLKENNNHFIAVWKLNFFCSLENYRKIYEMFIYSSTLLPHLLNSLRLLNLSQFPQVDEGRVKLRL